MYKILLADDENIVLESLKFIIEESFPEQCEIRTAKTGRSVIEVAEEFRPDIAFMDIQMPGINGIEAMREIRSVNESIIFIVMTAFDRFDYAKQAIDLNVLEYLSKPVTREKLEKVLKKAMRSIDERRAKRSSDLELREKLELAGTFMESGLIYSVLLGDAGEETLQKYCDILNVSEKMAYTFVLEAGEREDNGRMSNELGTSVRLERHYNELRAALKDSPGHGKILVGPIMSNKIVVFVPYGKETMEYGERAVLVENLRSKVHEIEDLLDVDLRSGVGSVRAWGSLRESYQQALQALRIGMGAVSHADDLALGVHWEESYPIQLERQIFEHVSQGKFTEVGEDCEQFWNWMMERQQGNLDDVRMKVIDFVLRAEREDYQQSGRMYYYGSRTNYFSALGTGDLKELKDFFLEKMKDAARGVANTQEESLKSPVKKALLYINENYRKDLSLDEISERVNVSPYYFSKLFKEEEGVNFVDYVTNLRMEEAKRLLKEHQLSVKEIAAEVGYQDANYFSRIFKKNEGCTPTEYK